MIGYREIWLNHTCHIMLEQVLGLYQRRIWYTKFLLLMELCKPVLWENMTPSLQSAIRAAQRSQIMLKSPTVISSCLSCLSWFHIEISNMSDIIAFWMHLHIWRLMVGHLTSHLQSKGALCGAAGGPGSNWNNLEVGESTTRVIERCACCCGTHLTLLMLVVDCVEYSIHY